MLLSFTQKSIVKLIVHLQFFHYKSIIIYNFCIYQFYSMSNLLEAIFNIVHRPIYHIKSHYEGKNKINNVGDALEYYIKDAFADSFDLDNEKRKEKYSEVFSWEGTQNNPPDIMIRGGDAIEVKKISNANSDIALNSSFPKPTIFSSNPMITQNCKDCEDWEEKDLIYCIGHVKSDVLQSIWMVYGSIYAAKHEHYEEIAKIVSSGIKKIPDVDHTETKELGRVNKVDPLRITSLRVRGMWHIQNPRKLFAYLHGKAENDFELICIVPLSKYNTFGGESRKKIENLNVQGFSIKDVEVNDPNNLANKIPSKLIRYLINPAA